MIQVLYRHYNVTGRESWRPTWFDYEKCFKNFIHTISQRNDVNMTIIYDGDDETNFVFKYDFKIVRVTAGSDIGSFNQTLNYIESLNLNDDDIVYLLENDYLHIDNWVSKVLDFFDQNKDKYLTLYDHADKYMIDYKDLTSRIITNKTHHFRTTPSTCGSFIVRNQILIEDLEFHKQSSNFLYQVTKVPVDHGKFLMLNTLKNREIFSPIPGLSTHCLNNFQSPNIDWEKISDNT